MSAFSSYPVVPLLIAAAAVALACAALLAARRLRRELLALRRELAGHRVEVADAVTAASGMVPGARTAAHGEEIRAAVTEALAEERERELAEARAFWAAQDAGETTGAPVYDAPGHDGPGLFDHSGSFDYPGIGERPGAGSGGAGGGAGTGGADVTGLSEFEVLPFLPRQTDRLSGGEPESPATPSRRRHHPSDPEFTPTPAVGGPEQTVARLAALAEAAVPLADVRPGPLGTLDLYVFTDGTQLCLTPGHRETAEQLAGALERGEAPVLLGGSGVSGAYALTFTYGAESVFILADRVVASL